MSHSEDQSESLPSTEASVTDGLEDAQEREAWEKLSGIYRRYIYEKWHRGDGEVGIRRREFAKYDSYEYQITNEDGRTIWVTRDYFK